VPVKVFRAPMRARDGESPPGEGAAFGLAHGLIGIGDTFSRRIERLASLEDGVFVWTCDADGWFHLGRVCGPYRLDDTEAARAVGITHVRPTRWLDEPFSPDAVPAAVAATFARGGRNLQQIHGGAVEEQTLALWSGT